MIGNSRNSPKAMNVMKNLKIRLANPKAPSPAQQNLVQPAQQPSLTIQVASTAGPSTSTLPVQMQAEEPAIPTSAPAQVLNDQQGPLQQEDDWRHQEDEDIFPAAVPIVIEASAAEDPYATRVLALKEKSDAESNKENVAEASQPIVQSHHGQRRLIDRQPNAQRIVFESQDSHASSQVSDVNSDVSFEHMHATADTAQKRSSKPAMKRSATEPARTQGRSPKKGRVEELSGSRSQAPARNREIDRPGPSRTQALVQIRDEDRPIPSQMDEYKAANAAAKEKTAFQIKPTQTRKPWSDDETSRLHELIVKYGVSWKLLEQEDKNRIGGPLLVNRDQTALKDKARNMKMDYLKYVYAGCSSQHKLITKCRASRHLPENFFRIPINENMITRLKSENITYDRETGQREDALLEDD